MTLQHGTVLGYIKFGFQSTGFIAINTSQVMNDVYFYIYSHFRDSLPPKYHIEFYSEDRRVFIILDDKVLNSPLTPFKFNPNKVYGEILDITDYVLLYIVEDPLVEVSIQIQTTTEDNNLTRALSDMKKIDEFDDTIMFDPSITLNQLNVNVVRQNNTSYDPETNLNYHHPNMMEASLAAEQAQSTSNHSDEYSVANESHEEDDTGSKRLEFSVDVNPVQKDQHLSDRFNVATGENNKSGISLVQGVKTEEQRQRKAQVLPIVQIPRCFLSYDKLILFFFAVYEEIIDHHRIWFKNPHKGFLLPEQLKPDATFSNPLILNLNRNSWTIDGQYILEIYLLTQRYKGVDKREEVYRLSEVATKEIHSAEHIPRSSKPIPATRIICVPNINNQFEWLSMALSNFIKPPERQTSSIVLGHAVAAPNQVHQQANTQTSSSMTSTGITAVPIVLSGLKRKRN